MTHGSPVVREGSQIHQALLEAAQTRRCIFFAGLSGVGKTLMVQQLTMIARAENRAVHLLQWDVARSAFESPQILERYPEVNGVTHEAIRKAVGLWSRVAISQWNEAHPDRKDLLIGETPLIGNRLMELARPIADRAEQLLASHRTLFLVPTPTSEVRAAITSARSREMTNPLHERERANANSDLLDAHWGEIRDVAILLGVNGGRIDSGFDPDLYAEVYLRLLKFRHARRLSVDEVLQVTGSPYEVGVIAGELKAAPPEVDRIMAVIASTPEATLKSDVAAWYVV